MSGSRLTATCVWRTSADVVLALQDRFGDPLDSYVNGSQVWLRDDGPNGVTLEWRLHPVAGYERPAGLQTLDVFPSVLFALRNGDVPPAAPESLWGGLEAFAAYGDDIEPATLSAAASASLGIAPDGSGLVDHRSVGDQWERSGGATSIADALLEQLSAGI